MLLQFIFVFAVILIMLAILALFIVKAGLQLKYLRIKENRDPGSITDFLSFDFSGKEGREKWRAFLMFPLMYAVVMDDENEKLLSIKRKVKRIHVAIYVLLIMLIILGVYSEKVFPHNS